LSVLVHSNTHVAKVNGIVVNTIKDGPNAKKNAKLVISSYSQTCAPSGFGSIVYFHSEFKHKRFVADMSVIVCFTKDFQARDK